MVGFLNRIGKAVSRLFGIRTVKANSHVRPKERLKNSPKSKPSKQQSKTRKIPSALRKAEERYVRSPVKSFKNELENIEKQRGRLFVRSVRKAEDSAIPPEWQPIQAEKVASPKRSITKKKVHQAAKKMGLSRGRVPTLQDIRAMGLEEPSSVKLGPLSGRVRIGIGKTPKKIKGYPSISNAEFNRTMKMMPSRKNTVQWWDTPFSFSARSTNQKDSRYTKNLEGLFPVAAAAAAASSPATKRTQFNVWLNEAIAAREAKAAKAKQDPFANLVNLSKEAAVSANRGGKRK